MTYQVLARKWRPRSFETLVGQDHVVRALTHALSTQRLHHAWLFTGTRGVGKTTLSRILAKSLNCETGITATPCGVCRACTEIDAGRFVDYVELDAASNRGVDEMTQLLEQAVYAPGSGRFKVYMIDEVHMLTGHAFNAMLKTLEEPPAHVKFILATTDPQKIPVTVLSRCLQFNLKQMAAESIVAHLQDVLGQETLPFETPALRLLAKAASGSMRDALSLTDQAIAYSAGNLTAEAVQGMLGAIDQRHLIDLLLALASGDATRILSVADELASRGLSYSGALSDLAIILSRIAIEQRVPGALPVDDPQAEDIIDLAQRLHPDQVQLFYSVAVHSRHELSLAPDEYAGFVMACLRMVSLAPSDIVPPPPRSNTAPASSAANGTPATRPAVNATEELGKDGVSNSGVADLSADVPAWEDLPVPSEAPHALAQNPPSLPQTPPTLAQTPPALTETPPTQLETAAPRKASAASAQVVAASTTQESAHESAARQDDEFETLGASGYEGSYDDDTRFEPADDYGEAGFADLGEMLPDALATDIPKRRKSKSARITDMTSQDWPAFAAALPLTGLAGELARQSEWVRVQDDVVHLRVAIRTLADTSAKSRVQTVLSEHFGRVIDLHVEYGATGDDTAHAVELAQRAQRQKDAEAAVQSDPFIDVLKSEFGAVVVPDSIRAAPFSKAA
jgi:DNA polymerase-3 subunit gamma/tau